MDAWALVSVSDKTGLDDLARYLTGAGLKLLATASTARHLTSIGLEVASVEALTGFGEILDGRVKTLHPLIYGGLLASDAEAHQAQRIAMGAPDIRVVVVNLYPFEAAYRSGAADDDLIEQIDIGGVSLIRAAAKNYRRAAVLVSPDQYDAFMRRPFSALSLPDRRQLAQRAFQHVAYYDAVIAEAMAVDSSWPDEWVLAGRRHGSLRYGENPHQSGAFYRTGSDGFAAAQVVQGKALSYNNLADADTAVRLAYEFEMPACAVVKHQTPCAAAVASRVEDAYQKAHDADPVSIFGGIVAVNRPVSADLAHQLVKIFLEVVIAPEVDAAALPILAAKKNLRVLTMAPAAGRGLDVKGIWGGFLVQPADRFEKTRAQFVHAAGPGMETLNPDDLDLAWKTVARAKSNAIVVVKNGVTIGVGSGQTNRIDAARQALERAGAQARGAVLASDGFFPFGDVMRLAQECGIAAVLEPGGSVRDDESVDVARASGVTLLMTGERHFRH